MPAIETITELTEGFQTGKRSAEETVRHCLQSIDTADANVRAFIHCDRSAALKRARELDEARGNGNALGPLAGVPIALKDNICTTSGATTCGSRMLEGFCSVYNAHVVDRLQQAGAILIGKTNLDAFAMGSSTEASDFAVTRNPWDTSRVAGGSSGGSAAAVAGGCVPGALGSDTGGSIRQPAAYCGVVGLKPTYGRVSRYGLVAFASSLDQIGPLTTTVEDAALLMSVIAGHDPRDSTSIDTPVPDYAAGLSRHLSGLRVGVYKGHFSEGLDDEVERAVREAIECMRCEGAEIVAIDLPHAKYAVACYYIIAPAEASSNLARFDGVRFGYRTENPRDILDLYSSSRGEAFGDEVKRRVMFGTYVLSSGYYDRYYLKALKVRTLIRMDFDEAFKQVDVIAAPVAPTTAFPVGEKTADPLSMYLTDIYTIPASLAGTCAVSVPCGFDSNALPIGLQLIGPAFGEETLLAAAHQYQQLTAFHKQTPP